MPGSALPALRGAARVAPTAAARPIDVTVSLKPRNASLLAYSASTSSGSKPMTTAQLRSLFAPSPADRAAVVAYMRGHGLHLERSGLLTLSFHGSAAAASRAFHVGLSTYRGADGHVFRAPDAAVRLPAAISPLVSSVTGLDTATKLHSLATGPELTPHTAVPAPCTAASRAKHLYGGYLPGDLATAYGHRSLIEGGNDGHGESIALVEFSNYKSSDISSFKSCFGLTTPVHTRPINGGSNTMSGAIEANLDIEVAMSNAPGLSSVEVYTAPNNIAQILPMVDQMINTAASTNTYIVSDSWGLCEDSLPPSFLQAESDELQLAAAAGLSFYAASGDSGSSDCESLQPNDTKLVVDDPASQPFVTGVGGTALHSADGADSTAWKHGGGGISTELVAAVLPERQPPSQLRQRRQVRQPDRLLPAGARHLARCQPQHRLHHRVHLGGLGLPERHPLVPGGRHQRRRAADGRHHGGREHLLAVSPRRPAHGIREPAALQRPEHVLGHHAGLQQHQRLRPLQGRRRLRPCHRAGLAQGRRAGDSPWRRSRPRRSARTRPTWSSPAPLEPRRSSTASRSPSPAPSPTRPTHRS